MAAGDIIIVDGKITPAVLQQITSEVVKNIQTTAKDPGQYEEVTSLQGVTSLPVFQVSGAAYKLVRVAVSILRGIDGKEIHLQVTATHIQWRYTDGMWDNLIAIADLKGAKGETPTFRTGATGIEWKYASEADTAWKVLVGYDVLKLKFTDLTPAQVDQLKLHFSDLTPADIAVLQKPATDAATAAGDKMAQIVTDANVIKTDLTSFGTTAKADEAKRVTAETARATAETERATKEAERIKQAAAVATAETARVNKETERNTTFVNKINETDAAIVKTNTAAAGADTAKKAADTAAGLANTSATNADTAAGKANTATGLAEIATKRANDAAIAAENIVSGVRPDWSITDKTNPNYIANKPEIPTLSVAPTPDTLTYTNNDGRLISYSIGDELRVVAGEDIDFYKLYAIHAGKAVWDLSGGASLKQNIYLTGADYNTSNVIKQGILI